MTEAEKKLAEMNGTTSAIYGQEVNRLIRERYSIADELAILRQRDEKPEEFKAYCEFAEACKDVARAQMGDG
jgi:hypothetical protein